MGYIPISLPGILDPSDPGPGDYKIQITIPSPLYDANIVLFAPAVQVPPVGLALVIRIQDEPGANPAHYIQSSIAAGQNIGTPVVGSMFIAAGALIFVRLISGPVGANAAYSLTGYFEITDGVSIAPLEALTKSTFEQQLSTIINRGTQFDIHIPGAVRRAIRFFETGNNFPYMRKVLSFLKDPAGSTEEASRDVVLGQHIKRLDCVRRYDPTIASREFTYLTGVGQDDIGKLAADILPEFYTSSFEDNTDDIYSGPALYIQLGCLNFPQIFQLEAVIYRYTDYREIRLYDDHWLLSTGESVVLGQAMINLAPIIRQPEAVQYWAPIVATGLKNLLLAADEIDIDQHAQQMGYGN